MIFNHNMWRSAYERYIIMIDEFLGKYRFLSNFYPCNIEYNGKKYTSTEHAFQAAKTLDESWHDRIQNAETPGVAKKLGKQAPMRPDWESTKIGVMEDLLRIKFNIPELKEKLLETGNRELIEGNFWNDCFWGVCEGKGTNHLGKLLMKVRNELGE